MKKMLGLFLIACTVINVDAAKIVGLVPERNENIYIAQCLKALAMYTDAIVVLDDASTDNTLEILNSIQKECKIEKIITKEKWYRDEVSDRNALLEAGRSIGGTHFIVIDADEILTSNLLNGNLLRQMILSLKPGETLMLNWIQLWRSTKNYRFDNSVWTYNYKDFIFCDNKTCSYTPPQHENHAKFIHTKRTPHGLNGQIYTMNGFEYGVMHFQFVNWRNLLIKQAWYICLERIRDRKKSSKAINSFYSASTDERGLGLKPVPKDWFSNYSFFDETIYNQPELWREKQIVGWFKEYGRKSFEDLDIWNVDWTNC